MIITPLWHTEFLIDIENPTGRNVRIMVDSWYSDYAIGDLMERTVKVWLGHEKLRTIDALYISHAHCDHFDPYMLMEIYTHANPLLLLPETLAYLVPLIQRYIPTIQIQLLRNKEVFRLHDIEIIGATFPQDYVTNEDDVFTLSVANYREILFAEIDIAPSETPETYKYLYRLFTKRGYETVCYIASRNELEGNLKILDYNTAKEREKFRNEYLHHRKEEIEWGYAKWEYEDYEDFQNYMTIPGFVRGFIGQGICYPRMLSETLSWLACLTLDEVVDREQNFAREHGYEFAQKVLHPGRQYRIEHGNIETGRKECPIGTLEKSVFVIAKSEMQWSDVAIQEDEKHNHESFIPQNDGNHTALIRKYSDGSLSKDSRNFTEQTQKIHYILNTRFLPYWFGTWVANFRDAILKNPSKTYNILITGMQVEKIVFSYCFSQTQFEQREYVEWMNIDEDYYANDIDDFLSWKQELYSNFWHKLDPKKQYRLWTVLGANFINHDLVLKKYALHFELAKAWKTAEDYFKELAGNI